MKHEPNLNVGLTGPKTFPRWVPDAARKYLEHTAEGRTLRALARQNGGHASTVLRQVRRIESRRDDPLVDEVLNVLECGDAQEWPVKKIADDHEIDREAKRILRRLCENTAFMVVAAEMKKAAIMRETTPGKPVRIAVLDRHVAQAFALRDWIECSPRGKITLYRITSAGKAALKRLLAQDNSLTPPKGGFAEAQSPFSEQHKIWGDRDIQTKPGNRPKRMRCNLAESPITALGRRKGADGVPFLSPDLVQAGECLREDFEMAQMGARVTQNWDRFLTMGRSGSFQGAGPAEGPMEARARVAAALKDLGPGLGDIALRCCCYLEGMETAEKRMGWSARSGKIVLRIALQRLKLHYEAQNGNLSPLIG